MEINKIYCENCLDTMARMPNETVDLTVTSPPYHDLRAYKGYSFDFEPIARELYRVTKIGGVVVWVVGDRVFDGSETLEPFRQSLYFKEIGFNVHDTMIYQKKSMPFPEQTRYIQCFEYMFVLSRGKPATSNLIKTETKGYKPSQSNTQRNRDGSTTLMKYERGKPERSLWNVWNFDVGYMKTTTDRFAYDHPAMFPEKLADRHIKTWSNEGDLIYDCFIGAGTTAKMAILNNRNFIGSEIASEYTPIYERRIQDAYALIGKGPKITEQHGVKYVSPPLFGQ